MSNEYSKSKMSTITDSADWANRRTLEILMMAQKLQKAKAAMKSDDACSMIDARLKKMNTAIDTLSNDPQKVKEYFEADMVTLDIIDPEAYKRRREIRGRGGMPCTIM